MEVSEVLADPDGWHALDSVFLPGDGGVHSQRVIVPQGAVRAFFRYRMQQRDNGVSGNALADWDRIYSFNADTFLDTAGNGIPDLIFQNNLGQIAVWYLNASGATTSSAYLYTGSLGDWRVVGAADINGDTKTDLVFQNTDGQIAVWYMNGSGAVTSTGFLSTSSLGDWRIAGIADMNGDGIADLIFQNNAGQIAAWYLNASGGTTSTGYLSTGALGDWRVR